MRRLQLLLPRADLRNWRAGHLDLHHFDTQLFVHLPDSCRFRCEVPEAHFRAHVHGFQEHSTVTGLFSRFNWQQLPIYQQTDCACALRRVLPSEQLPLFAADSDDLPHTVPRLSCLSGMAPARRKPASHWHLVSCRNQRVGCQYCRQHLLRQLPCHDKGYYYACASDNANSNHEFLN